MTQNSTDPVLSFPAIVGLTLLAAVLRLPGLADLPFAVEESIRAPRWIAGWLGATPFAARAIAATAGLLAVPLAAAWLAPRVGRGCALAAALLIAACPWHVHASRLATLDSVVFLTSFAAATAIAGGWPAGRGARARRLLWLATTGLAAVFLASQMDGRAGSRWLPFLCGDLAVGLLGFAALAPWSRAAAPRGQLAGALALLLLALPRFLPADVAAAWQAPLQASIAAVVVLAAALVLGRLFEAVTSHRATLALCCLALVPCLPALIAEHQDAGRFDLAALAEPFRERRKVGEPLYAACPELTARSLGAAAQPIELVLSDKVVLPRPDRAAWVLLLLERGELIAELPLPPDFESRFELVARSAHRRFDLRRYEARLYRCEAAR
ncbi:MAG: hypothetical protein EXS13_11765 [Planctomycetes bacterium]|nr:hypothetical protein [Planctomycetota bacterium]